MKYAIITNNGMQYYTISEISGKIQRDVAYLRKKFEIVAEEYEKLLVRDLERFFVDGIAREIRLALYDPLQNNRVFMEYSYRLERTSSYSSGETLHSHTRIADVPETCLFDIFIYYTAKFGRLTPKAQEDRLKIYNIDWYDLHFNLRYNKETKRKKAGVINSARMALNRYIYEQPVDEAPDDNLGEMSFGVNGADPVGRSRADGGREGRFKADLIEAVRGGRKLNYVVYNDLEDAVDVINGVLSQCDRVPVRWSLSRGFTVDDLGSVRDGVDVGLMSGVKNPVAALNFVIDNREQRVSYVFDDFHHHIGGDAVVNAMAAEIRSVVRDLSRDLQGRDEFVFFMSPSESLPIELVPVFNIIREGAGAKGSSFVSRYGVDMTDPVACGQSKPLIGKGDKVKRIIQILCQMETNNPLLVGGPGVGKTALIEGLAREIVNENVPPILAGKTIFALNLNTLVAGSRYRGDFEERIGKLMDEVKSRSGDMIVFIDEIHTLVGAGSAEGVLGAEDVLKPALARGDFPCIGATTYDGYELMLKDPALVRRFQRLEVPAATAPETESILCGVRHVFEKHHDVVITDEAVRAAVVLSERYILDQSLPGKAIRLLDSASAFVKLDNQERVDATAIKDEIKRGL